MGPKKRCGVLSLVSVAVLLCTYLAESSQAGLGDQINDTVRSKVLFDFAWRFHRGDIQEGQREQLDDASWRLLDLPHDWSVEDIPGTDSPLDPQAVGGIDMGYFVGGTAWYRKTFSVPSRLQGKRFYLQFDGVYMNADVWLNSQHLGSHPYGYTGFQYDITDALVWGADNVLAVQVKNEGKNSRWYSGSGIYRHVWLCVVEPIHVAPWGAYVTTPDITQEMAEIHIETRLTNALKQARGILLRTTIIDPQGTRAGTVQTRCLLPGSVKTEIKQTLQVKTPALWSTENAQLYSAVTELFEDSDTERLRPLDRIHTAFGMRTLHYDVQQGFLLNGKPVLLKGGCMHHGNGPLGAAAYDRAEERRVELMKASGFNAIRCAHNPPSSAFLDACDRLGVLVIDESFDMWRIQKKPQDYHLYFDEWWKRDIDSMVLRDRNHPCVIMWSTGNEIPERGSPAGVKTSRMLGDYIRALDPTRPVTAAVNGLKPDKDPYFATLDLAGYNYAVGGDHWQESLYAKDHKRVPDRIIYCAESYPWDAFGSWMAVLDLSYVIGDFVWTGFDYLGEASIGWLGYLHRASFYPWHQAFCGDIDICGFKRPQSFYRDALWQHREGTPLSIFVRPLQPSFAMLPGREKWSKWHWHDVVADWTWPGQEGKTLDVDVYCAYERVELLLNGESLGTKPTNRNTQWIARWQVPYQPGTLRARAFEGGDIWSFTGPGFAENLRRAGISKGAKQVAAWQLRTADAPSQIRLSADRVQLRSDAQDLSYVTVELLDRHGVRHPKADQSIEFDIQGPGSIRAVGSSNPRGTESFQGTQRRAYQGRCLVIVKSKRQAGRIKLRASSPGLKSAQVVITSE